MLLLLMLLMLLLLLWRRRRSVIGARRFVVAVRIGSIGGCFVGVASEEDTGWPVELRVSRKNILQLRLARTCYERREALLVQRVTYFRSFQALPLDDGALAKLLGFLETKWPLLNDYFKRFKSRSDAGGRSYFVVDLNEVSELFGEDATTIVDWQLATWNDHFDWLLKVACRSLQETHHQVLQRRETDISNFSLIWKII